MIPILLISHLGLASGMKKASEFIVGEQKDFYALELDESGIENFKSQLNELKELLGKSVILVSDINFGSPSMTAYSVLSESMDVNLISGMNLPLVIDLLLSRNKKETEQLLIEAINGAKEEIKLLEFTSEDESDEF